MSMTFADPDDDAIPLFAIDAAALEESLAEQPPAVAAWARRNGFKAGIGEALLAADPEGSDDVVALAGLGTKAQRARDRFALAAAAAKLPAGTYRLAGGIAPAGLETEALGWLLAQYRFQRYRAKDAPDRRLVAPEGIDRARVETIAASEALVRDLINTPASDMGPAELQAAAEALAGEHGAEIETIVGQDLLERNYPLIHTVGRASTRAPRLIDLRWGGTGPLLTLVGKGVCFDTGGLNLKPGSSMALMKKDMGGAANVLGLARMIMALGLPLRLRVLIPAVENAVSGDSFRPGDILPSRKGLSVEINNTDAEGRLVLADALALATEESPDLVISMATLTGAARVALGPDIAPFFTDDAEAATALEAAAREVEDPVWRLPFHAPYETLIEPGIADLDNAPSGGFAGAITAALFLRRFAQPARYMHFDIYGWTPSAKPARPKGGAGQGVRALLQALPRLLPL